MKGKRIIAIDLDNTLAKYDGWTGYGEIGEPMLNAKWALDLIKKMDFIIIVYTCREETTLVKEWLDKHEIPYDHINYCPVNSEVGLSPVKIYADIYVDDRGIGFRGDWNHTITEISKFKNWSDDMMVVSSKDI